MIALAWLHVSIRANGLEIHEPARKANPMLMGPAPERRRLLRAGLDAKNCNLWLTSKVDFSCAAAPRSAGCLVTTGLRSLI